MTEPSPPVSGSAFWFSLLLAVAVTLAGVSFAIGAYTAVTRPDAVVLDYFAALGRGDAAGALGYGPAPHGPKGLLTSAVLADQNAAGPIENVGVLRVRQRGATARVDVTYTVALRSGPLVVADTVPVVRQGRGWRLVWTAVTERVRPGNGSELAAFAGAAVPEGEVPMFPGAVPVTYDTPLLTAAPDHRVVRFADDGGALPVDAMVSPAGRATLGDTVAASLAACLAGRSRTEELCPTPNGDAGVPGSLRGTLDGPASLTFAVPSAGGRIEISGTVPVRGTFQRLDDDNIAASQVVRATPVSGFSYATRPGSVWWAGS